jgi:hypothetical protein
MRAISALLLLLLSPLVRGEMVIAGLMVLDGRQLFILKDTTTNKKSPWLARGESWFGYTLNFEPVVCITKAADAYRERLISVRATPAAGFKSKPGEHLILASGSKTYEVNWYLGYSRNALTLFPGHQYEFVLTEHSFPQKYGSRVWYDVQRVTEGDRVLFDAEVCEVHQARLQSKYVENRHGLARVSSAYLDARRDSFPHSESGRTVSCVGDLDEPPSIKINVCAQCEQACLAWVRRNGK